jgi:NADH-quinone oxidoreductase subunit E
MSIRRHSHPMRHGPQVPRYEHGSRVPGWDEAADLEKDPGVVPDPATTFVPEDLRTEIELHMAKYPDRRSAAMPALAAAQRRYGWCSPKAIEQVACVMRLTPGYLDAVATFYDMLESRPVGRHQVYVCTNISCSLRGADALFETMLAAAGEDPDFNVRAFECLGACDIAPMASVDGIYVGPLELGDVERILDDVRELRPVLPEKQLRRMRVADPEANERDWPAPEAEDRAAAGAGLGDRIAESGPGMGAPREGWAPAGEAASAAVGEQPSTMDEVGLEDPTDVQLGEAESRKQKAEDEGSE